MVSMLNQAAIDAVCSATYLDSYLDCVDDLPNELQHIVSSLRELDCLTNELVNEMTRYHETWQTSVVAEDKKRTAQTQLQRCLGKLQELGDQKLSLVSEIIDKIETATRQLDCSLDNLEPGSTTVLSSIVKEEDCTGHSATPVSSSTRQAGSAVAAAQANSTPADIATIAAVSASPAVAKQAKSADASDKMSDTGSSSASKFVGKRQKRQRGHQETVASVERDDKKMEEEEKTVSLRKKKAKREKSEDQLLATTKLSIDPNEPTYCLCKQVSYGEMIGCDNESCEIEWFHFDCVKLTHKPKGKWFCPDCRGARPNVLKPDLLSKQQKRSD